MQPASLSLWLTAAVTPLAIALATAALARERRPDNVLRFRNNPRENSSSEDDTSSSDTDSNSDS